MKKHTFRISPAFYSSYRLEEKVWIFWFDVSFSNSLEHLKLIVRNCGGILVGEDK